MRCLYFFFVQSPFVFVGQTLTAGDRAVRFLMNRAIAGSFSRWLEFSEESIEVRAVQLE